MTQNINHLIAALREELQQYGEMLARLEEQQERVLRRDADQILQSVSAIQEQGLVIQRARDLREERQKQTAAVIGLDTTTAEFSAIIPKLPNDYRELVETLVTENNSLLQRIQQRARQNHLLLRQSLELMQRFMSTLFPSQEPRVYNPGGQVFARPTPAVSLYEAVG